MPTPAQLRKLTTLARAAAARAYAPYSRFRVGAAVLTATGKTFAGCNVENASYGLCNCAERSAIFGAAAAGERKLRCVLVYTPTPLPTAPCGACRQVIFEFGPETQARVARHHHRRTAASRVRPRQPGLTRPAGAVQSLLL